MKLKNVSNRMVVVTLPHDEVCGAVCYCGETQHLQSVHNGRTGESGVRQIRLSVPASLHIPAKSITDELPEEFLKARSLKDAMNNGLRKVA